LSYVFIISLSLLSLREREISGDRGDLDDDMLFSSILCSRDSRLCCPQAIYTLLDDFFKAFCYFVDVGLRISLECFFGIDLVVELYSSVEVEAKLILAMRDKRGD
jgi:hypothetical protein